ncbi:unnamed protein product [Moneuplotes crassus]|uniref:Uncharacterized protein n=1 Tax=Euplotes crassus TaxID=5936 RepID=A0AAD1Y3D2_EUPCR|nr:unnamed protein product [Moneuplotes crassus]
MKDKNPYKMPVRASQPKPSRYEQFMNKLELKGYKAANKIHRYFVNCIFLFMGYNLYIFVREYNAYWRLRRDSDLPEEWLEDIPKNTKEFDMEKERIEREKRIT